MKSFLIIAIVLLYILVSSDFADGQCGGTNQSPIDFNTATDRPILLNFSPASLSFINAFSITNGYGQGITVNLESLQNTITIDGSAYYLLEAQFHTPSEHTFNGYRYDAEIHYVFKDYLHDRLSVIAFPYASGGGSSNFLNSIQSSYPPKCQTNTIVPRSNIDWSEFTNTITQNAWYYKYYGSLTTYPCTEGITWFVYGGFLFMSADQLNRLQQSNGFNARPTQPRNGRQVPPIF